MKKLEILEDFFIVLDVVCTFFAIAFKNMGMQKFENIFFGISGVGLMLALVAMIVKWICVKRTRR